MQKLKDIQVNLKAPKGQKNTFGGYMYRSCEDVYKSVKPLLSEYNCSLIITDDLVYLEGRYYVKATATLTDNETKEFVVVTAYAREGEEKKGMDGSQITGASSSYARKYALNGLFLIDNTNVKDADMMNNNEDTPKTKQKSKKPTVSPATTSIEQERINKFIETINSMGAKVSKESFDGLLKEFNISAVVDLTDKNKMKEFYTTLNKLIQSEAK